MKHYPKLDSHILADEIKTGDYFTYEFISSDGKRLFRKGLKLNRWMMIPIGLASYCLVGAEKQN
jgi:hypothetical protein